MRMRVTARGGAGNLESDLIIECAPDDVVGDVVDGIRRAFPADGTPTVEGRELAPGVPVAESPLHAGAVVDFGPPAAAPAGVRTGPQYRARVLSGPDAGTVVAVQPGVPLVIGRAADAGLVLADRDVSRRHAEVLLAPDGRVTVSDIGSVNGVWIDGSRADGPSSLAEEQSFQVGGTRVAVERADSGRVRITVDPATGDRLVNRHHTASPPWQPAAVALPEPPRSPEKRAFPWVMLVAPLLVSVAGAALLRQPTFLIFAALGPVYVLATHFTDRRQRRQRNTVDTAGYDARLSTATAEVEAAVDDEDAHLRRIWPDPATVVMIATLPRRELWQRRPGAPDWLGVRLGTADRPASVTVDGTRPADWTEPALTRAPVGVSLARHPVLGIGGPPALAGASLRWAVLQLAVLHDPAEVRLAVLAPGAREADLGWLRWLPHVRAGAGALSVAWTEAETDALVKALGETLAARTGTSRTAAAATLPVVVVVLAGAAALRLRQPVQQLLARGPGAGFAFVCVESDESGLPGECQAVLRRGGSGDHLAVSGVAAGPLRADDLPAPDAEAVARALAPLQTVSAQTTGARMPDSVRWTDLCGRPDPGTVRASWALADDGLAVVAGADEHGPVEIDLVRHGPHALIAGTTGAGKSELLQTLLAALAAARSPEQLNFLFVDYKGGSTYQDLQGLPHVVGLVTNLEQRDDSSRALSSLRAELERRQRQLADAGVPDVSAYLRKRATDPLRPPFPRLVIVIDEFAELKERLPEVLDELVAVARLGRSLGVHLILATQRPGGVVSQQIQSNTDLRICLRVADDADSVDIIGTVDAARIPRDTPGRAYVSSSGFGLRAVQFARITTARAAAGADRCRVVPVRWHDHGAPERVAAQPAAGATDVQSLVGAVTEAAAADRITAPYPVLCPPLPATVPLTELLPAAPLPDRLVLGLQDLPARQRRDVLTVPLDSGHLAVVGSARAGRTTALRGLAAGLALAHRPDELHLHVLDAGGALAALEELPHTGVVCGPDDPGRVDRLLGRLTELVTERRALLSQRRAGTVAELREREPDAAPPRVVLLIDGWEMFAETSGGPRLDQLTGLLAHGLAAGLTACLAGDETLLRGKLLARITHRLVLRLNNPSDAGLAGLPLRALPAGLPAGRALWTADASEVQLPLLDPDPAGGAQSEALSAIAWRLRATHPQAPLPARAPLRLDALPLRITAAEADKLAPHHGSGPAALVGVGGDVLMPVRLDLGSYRRILVAGPHRSGRSTTAAAIAASLSAQGVRVAVVAGRARSGVPVAGVRVVPAADWAAAPDAPACDAVIVDDADALPADHPVFDAAPAVILTATLDAVAAAVRGPLLAARQAADATIVLCPADRYAAQKLYPAFSPAMAFTGPAGRGYLLTGGEALLIQVPVPGQM